VNFQEVAHSVAERDSRHHTQKMQKQLQEIRDHLREDIATPKGCGV
jgi:hypothetical protein